MPATLQMQESCFDTVKAMVQPPGGVENNKHCLESGTWIMPPGVAVVYKGFGTISGLVLIGMAFLVG